MRWVLLRGVGAQIGMTCTRQVHLLLLQAPRRAPGVSHGRGACRLRPQPVRTTYCNHRRHLV